MGNLALLDWPDILYLTLAHESCQPFCSVYRLYSYMSYLGLGGSFEMPGRVRVDISKQ